ncbi:hypothetical protein RAS1_40000 [Phycisphaerae bacterium RAS1]|nr:hypothetical protein RAS1_40000 [Phycisphaerae bacterium RAS1]
MLPARTPIIPALGSGDEVPQFGHGLVGAALAIATSRDPTSPRLRQAWLGTGVLLGYWPDIAEWGLTLCGVRLPHAAPASIWCAAASVLLVVGLLRGGFGEKSRLTLLAATLMIASHSLLDGVSGGIPLWWPIDSGVTGPDWLGLDNLPLDRRLRAETLAFVPVLAIGLAVRAVRRRPPAVAVAAALAAAAAAVISAGLGSVVGVLMATAALILEKFWFFRSVGSPRPTLESPSDTEVRRYGLVEPRWALNLVPLMPVILLAAVQVYAWRNIHAGLTAMQRGDFETGLQCNREAARFRPVDLEATARYRVAECQLHLGRFVEAHEGFRLGRAEFPGCVMFLDGLAQVYLAADDPALRRPSEALALALEAQERSRDPAYRRWIQQFIDQARAAGGTSGEKGRP